jgi:(1->4)-alpha-D-glucan 1-alpha-D-glucosylmutase
MTTPGVPDIYQGGELLDLSLVDPDNRRPVDYELRARMLDELQDLLDSPDADEINAMILAGDERAKMYFTARLLRLRTDESALFKGDYRPIGVKGSDHWIVFARESEDSFLVVCVPRFPSTWPERRGGTIPLPPEAADMKWKEVLSGRELTPGSDLSTLELPLPWGVLVTVSPP